MRMVPIGSFLNTWCPDDEKDVWEVRRRGLVGGVASLEVRQSLGMGF